MRIFTARSPIDLRQGSRRAFTLVEMLIVIAIILILSVITVTAVTVAFSTDRVSASSRQVQSYLEGARDRAIFAKKVRGVRFLRNPDDPNIVDSMIYLGDFQTTEGRLRVDTDGRTLIHEAGGAGIPWFRLARLGLLQAGTRIRIANDPSEADASNGLWYHFDFVPGAWFDNPPPDPPPDPEQLAITTAHLEFPTGTGGDTLAYTIELAPAILPGSDPVQLVQGIVIDLDQSRVPGSWRIGSNYTNQMDLLFTPDGRITGPAAASGLVHLIIRDQRDRLEGRPPADPNNLCDDSLVTIFTRTGYITTHPVRFGDRFFYAQTGEAPDEK
jgi:prepilin-type N-terminal cleavage/methylation domain-containing protein